MFVNLCVRFDKLHVVLVLLDAFCLGSYFRSGVDETFAYCSFLLGTKGNGRILMPSHTACGVMRLRLLGRADSLSRPVRCGSSRDNTSVRNRPKRAHTDVRKSGNSSRKSSCELESRHSKHPRAGRGACLPQGPRTPRTSSARCAAVSGRAEAPQRPGGQRTSQDTPGFSRAFRIQPRRQESPKSTTTSPHGRPKIRKFL